MRTLQKPAADYDTGWKLSIERFFPNAIQFFFPDIYDDIDWTRGFAFLDKELQQARPRGKKGRRSVDKLARVWRKSGQEAWLLLHLEIQNRKQQVFPERMFIYSYRLYDFYGHPVVSLAILGDNNPDWRPQGFSYDLFGTGNQHRFRIVKLLDYEAQWEMLEQSNNPFAVVVMIHLRGVSTQRKDEQRLEWKLRLTKGLYDKCWSEDAIIDLFRMLDFVMPLPPQLEQRFQKGIYEYEKEKHTMKLAPFEQRAVDRGMEQGMQQGMLQGMQQGMLQGMQQGMLRYARAAVITALDVRFGSVSAPVQDAVNRIESLVELDELHRKALRAQTLEEFQQSLAS